MIRRKRTGDRGLDAALDRCLAAVEAGEAPEDAAAREPAGTAELASLLATAGDLRRALSLEPDPARRSATRARVLAAAAASPARPVGYRPWARLGRALAPLAAAFLALALLLGASVEASAHALPGDTLYPLKLAVERVRYAAALSQEDRAALHLEFAERRLEEVQALTDRGRPVSEGVLDALASELDAAARARQEGDLSAAGQARLEWLAGTAQAVLQALAEQAPNDAARRALESAQHAGPPAAVPPAGTRPGEAPRGSGADVPGPDPGAGPPDDVPRGRPDGAGPPADPPAGGGDAPGREDAPGPSGRGNPRR